MITEFKPGTFYKLSPNHHLYWGAFQSASRIFLCTAKMYCPIVDEAPVFNYTPRKVHLLIDVDTGGLWASDPSRQEYEEYLQ